MVVSTIVIARSILRPLLVVFLYRCIIGYICHQLSLQIVAVLRLPASMSALRAIAISLAKCFSMKVFSVTPTTGP